MFSGNDSQVLTRRRQVTALLVSGLSHVLALSVLLILGSHGLTELDAPFKDVVFVAYPMNLDDVRLPGIKERGPAENGPKKSSKGGTTSKREKPQPPAPAPPASPDFNGRKQRAAFTGRDTIRAGAGPGTV